MAEELEETGNSMDCVPNIEQTGQQHRVCHE